MINANEARELSGKTIQELAEDFDEPIRKAAKDGKRSICHYHGTLENEAYSRTEKWDKFVAHMDDLGFTVSLHYEERQFVDMRINVKWE
jgi:hypothetical protein